MSDSITNEHPMFLYAIRTLTAETVELIYAGYSEKEMGWVPRTLATCFAKLNQIGAEE